jgi:hypothetical protein
MEWGGIMSTSLYDPSDWWKIAINSPLSGPVQIFQDFGFHNYNEAKTGEKGPIIEKRTVDEVASYGRQLGWIMEVLSIVLDKIDKHQELNDLTEKQIKNLEDFRKLIRSVENIKAVEQRSKSSMPDFEEIDLTIILNKIRALKDTNPKTHAEMMTRIENFIIEEKK